MTIQWDFTNPLTRCPGETRRASAALSDYAAMGAGRSLRGLWAVYGQRLNDECTAADVPARQVRTIMRWSSVYDWQARIDAYDAQQQEAARAATETARLAAIERAIDDQLEDARIMRDKGRAIMSTLPLVKERGKGGDGEIIEIAPASSAEYNAAARMFKEAAQLEAARLGLPTEVHKQDLRTLNIDVSQLTDEQLTRIANGEDPLVVLATTSAGGS